jgi:hypothetical protein
LKVTENVDFEYLQRWATELAVADLLERGVRGAGGD